MKLLAASMLFLFLVESTSCRRCPCPTNPLQILFVGFDSTELKTVVLKKFEANNSFQTILNSETLDSLYTTEFVNDTASKPYARIEHGFDWEVILADLSDTFRVTNMLADPTKDPYCGGWIVGERFCSKPIISLQINGQLMPIANDSYRYQTVYIHK